MLDNGPSAWADWNFLAAELDLVERIKGVAQSGPNAWARIVGTRDDISSVTEEQQVVPGVYVIYGGFAIKNANEFKAEVEHRWRVVLAVATAAKVGREASLLNQVAGKYLPQLLQALHGYIPLGSTTPLIPVTPPPFSTTGKFGYYPLAFTSDTFYSTRSGPGIVPLDRR